ncbi:MAG TPA: hypothetical protein VJ717_18100 [Gemmatimonadaceae bacterium]|nr:hypothetical protein [Gemmatimonadaceae bacterium]
MPGIGGIFIDSGDVLVAHVRDAGSESQALTKLTELQAAGKGVFAGLGNVKRSEIRRGTFAFSELVAGQRSLAAQPNEKLRTVDADERTNRITVTVSDSAGVAKIISDASRLGIPHSAISIRIDPIAPSVAIDLAGRHRPTLGGVALSWSIPFTHSENTCSLGFNVTRVDSGSTRFYTTAAHCFKIAAGFELGPFHVGDGNWLYQPGNTSQDDLGSLSFIDLWDESGCSVPLCTSSDIAQVRYYSNIETFKSVARTQAVNSIYRDVIGTFPVVAITSPVVGSYVHKVGYRTGWTSGQVYSTCEYVNVSVNPPHEIGGEESSAITVLSPRLG